MKVLVCGSRGFKDKQLLHKVLDDVATEFNLWAEPDQYGNTLPLGMTILSGEAAGADDLATDYAVINWTGYKGFPADWNTGRSAGYVRNQKMIDEKPDLVVAFWDGESRGTKHTIDLAKAAGIPVKVIRNE